MYGITWLNINANNNSTEKKNKWFEKFPSNNNIKQIVYNTHIYPLLRKKDNIKQTRPKLKENIIKSQIEKTKGISDNK